MDSEVFPVINSTLSPVHLAAWVEEKYNFTGVFCRLLRTNINHTYHIKANDDEYVLRIYDHKLRQRQQVEDEVKLLNELKDSISLSWPVATVKGTFIEVINAAEGQRLAVMFSFAQGKKMRHFSTEIHFKIGAEIGRLHMAARHVAITREYTVDILLNWSHKELAKHFSEELQEMKVIKNSIPVFTEVFSKPFMRRGVVHLDMWYDNMSVSDNGSVIFFDFDNIGNSWLVLDIGYYCMHLFFIETDKAEYERKKKAFIDGYRSITPVTDEELEAAPYGGFAIWVYYLGLQAQSFNNVSNLFLSENYLKMMIGRFKEWLKYNNIEIPEV